MGDIENTSWRLLDDTNDLADIWTNAPWRRREFGDQEIADIREASVKLNNLIHELEAKVAA